MSKKLQERSAAKALSLKVYERLAAMGQQAGLWMEGVPQLGGRGGGGSGNCFLAPASRISSGQPEAAPQQIVVLCRAGDPSENLVPDRSGDSRCKGKGGGDDEVIAASQPFLQHKGGFFLPPSAVSMTFEQTGKWLFIPKRASYLEHPVWTSLLVVRLKTFDVFCSAGK